MILIDTNVVSELMRAQPSQAVINWFGEQDSMNLYLTAVTEAELRTGAAILPFGKRKNLLLETIDALIEEDFSGRVMPFDSQAAKAYAEIAIERRRAGRPILEADCQIAAIARAYDASIATRNVSDFEGCGIDVVNPWDHA